jgi:Uma2 family endonuclease
MTMLIDDPRLEEQLKGQRAAWGADHHDEIWEGVYFMTPLPNNEHQQLVMALSSVLYTTINGAGLGEAFPGVNLAGSDDDWEHDYRVPDIAVFLKTGAAQNRGAYWRGAADFVVEIVSPGDRTREKIPFYGRLGVRELLVVDRGPWTLDLYRLDENGLAEVGTSTSERKDALKSTVVPLRFRLVAAKPRPKIEVIHTETGQQWLL